MTVYFFLNQLVLVISLTKLHQNSKER